MTKKIGITGGIGSGKSIISHFFSILGIPIYNADIEAKKILYQNEDVKSKIINEFGLEAYIKNVYNRDFIAKSVFNNPAKLEKLNQIVHPAIGIDFENWVDKQNTKFVLKEAALLIESKSYKSLDEVILVKSPLELRIQRIQQRDTFRSIEEINKIINSQLSDSDKSIFCKYQILNNENQLISTQVLDIYYSLI